MRGVFLATAAAALMGSAVADVAHMRRHGHDIFHQRRNQLGSSVIAAPDSDATCGCTTEVVTIYGSPVPVPISTPEPTTTVTSQSVTTVSSTTSTTVTVVVTATPSSSIPPPPPPPSPTPTLPTPSITSFSSTGVYTIPATTITVTDTTTVCGATTTDLPSGTHTFGGVTTIVETSTVITCPYATVKPTGTTVTSIIETTTYVCPSAGTYTIAPTTTYVPESTVLVYPVPQTYTPGVYSHPAQTVTVTRTDYTYVCPFTGADEPTPAPTVPASAPSTPTPVANSSPVNAPALSDGDHMGITYTPYTNAGGCKPKAQVLADIAIAKQKGFTHIRVYSTDCDTLEFVGEACRQHGLIMIIGVFIKETGIEAAQSQVEAIVKWAQWDMVTLIVVGNEAISSGYVNPSDLAGFIQSCKQTFTQAGYSGAVTTTEPINIWEQHGSTLCPAIDILGANIHPFFNSAVSASDAGNFVLEEVKLLRKICNGMDVINLETGWPSNGNANGDAVPNQESQVTALRSIQSAFGGNSVFFSFSNDGWKNPGPWDVEQYWGCIDAF